MLVCLSMCVCVCVCVCPLCLFSSILHRCIQYYVYVCNTGFWGEGGIQKSFKSSSFCCHFNMLLFPYYVFLQPESKAWSYLLDLHTQKSIKHVNSDLIHYSIQTLYHSIRNACVSLREWITQVRLLDYSKNQYLHFIQRATLQSNMISVHFSWQEVQNVAEYSWSVHTF